ncbi:MAG: SAM-dependent methyltransferase [Pseudomonadales bacterium]|nr:SAM-dependent methyltransferase [Pseudomonadales bacterium]
MRVEAVLGASFRDPDGFMYRSGGRLLRKINPSYLPHYERLLGSGLLAKLWDMGLLVRHEIVSTGAAGEGMVIAPQEIPYVCYPYEWSFGQLKQAALLTLRLQKIALEHGMSLKDASAYNVQFRGATPVFIDTLSFENHVQGQPWVAYRQFCQHFLGPLALMAYGDVRLRNLLRSYIDGLPLDLVASLLPRRTFLRYSLLSHVHLHARTQRSHANDAVTGLKGPGRFSTTMMLALVESLKSAVQRLEVRQYESEWGRYYADTNYSPEAMSAKETLVQEMISRHFEPGVVVHDIGANTGRFSRLAETPERLVVAHDIDEMAVEFHYREASSRKGNVLPLVLDLTNPAPSLGWAQGERDGFAERVAGGNVLALALIHHIAISNNVPLPRVAGFFATLAGKLLIEFVSKEDSQVRRLLATREDIFPDYTEAGFEAAFGECFHCLEKRPIDGTARVLYLFESRVRH